MSARPAQFFPSETGKYKLQVVNVNEIFQLSLKRGGRKGGEII